MKRPDDLTRLRHIVEAAHEVALFLEAKTRDDLHRDPLLARAVVKSIEIVGEAAARISPKMRAALPEIPWPDIVSMRNHLVHGYFDINLDVVWSTAQDDLPPLLRQVEAALARLSPGGS